MPKNANAYKTFNIDEGTPKELYEKLNGEFHFDFDPTPLGGFTEFRKTDTWGKSNFINPPYGKEIRKFLERAITLKENVVFLLPAYTDVKWFHELVLPHAKEIRFIKGRLKFGDHKESAPFASMLVIFGYSEFTPTSELVGISSPSHSSDTPHAHSEDNGDADEVGKRGAS
jgi:site-specific DNA-methyltransferase (adenine-specific)